VYSSRILTREFRSRGVSVPPVLFAGDLCRELNREEGFGESEKRLVRSKLGELEEARYVSRRFWLRLCVLAWARSSVALGCVSQLSKCDTEIARTG